MVNETPGAGVAANIQVLRTVGYSERTGKRTGPRAVIFGPCLIRQVWFCKLARNPRQMIDEVASAINRKASKRRW